MWGGDEQSTLSNQYLYGINIIHCKICNFTYSENVLHSQYDKQLYAETDKFYHIYLRLKKQPVYQQLEQTKANYIIQTAYQLLKQRGNILDIGSAVGSVVSAAQQQGWNATGIEINPLFLQESQAKNLNIIEGFFPDAMPIDSISSYQAISMLDVLEHIVNPIEFIGTVKKYLASKGIILIQVPNLNSLYIQLDGSNNSNFCIGHWSYFTPQTLNMTLEKAGFENLFLETYISEFDKIQQFPEAEIKSMIHQLTGKEPGNIKELTIDWLHENLLGYKIFGIYRLQ